MTGACDAVSSRWAPGEGSAAAGIRRPAEVSGTFAGDCGAFAGD
ncbi:hypothetical protein [Streptomyces collinus]|nr:hypothetical protein [Streptomyces collinus]